MNLDRFTLDHRQCTRHNIYPIFPQGDSHNIQQVLFQGCAKKSCMFEFSLLNAAY